MNISKLLLTKKEIPVVRGNCIQIPIHPSLLDPNIQLDKTLAEVVFEQAANEWYQDMLNHLQSFSNKKQEWYKQAFLYSQPKIIKENNRYLKSTPPRGGWHCKYQTLNNGFAHSLSISRDAGGSLFLAKNPELICHPFVKFSQEKFNEYSVENNSLTNAARSFHYDTHNIDHFPGALFLRNWALLYLNAAMTSLSKK